MGGAVLLWWGMVCGGLGRGGDDIICNRLLRGWFLLLRPFQDGDGLDSCFSFQGKFFHFLAINRHREIEYDLLYPASVFPFLREHEW